MKRFAIGILISLISANVALAQQYLWRYQTHATDCTSVTGKVTDLCYEQDSQNLYKCVPSAGDCDTAGEWKLVDDNGLVSGDINTYSELNTIVSDVTLTHNGLIDTFSELDTIVADETLVNTNDSQTLTNKILTTPVVTLEQGTAPSQTAEGRIQWDTDDNRLVVGDGSTTQTFYAGAHTTDTNANTVCAGTTTYLDGEGNCDDISSVYEAADASIIKSAEIDTYSELNTIVSDVTLTHNGLIDTFAEIDAIVADKALVNKADGAVWLGAHDFGGATIEIDNGTVAQLPAASTAGRIAVVTDGASDTDCTSGGGSTVNLCIDSGTAWVIAGDGTSASGADAVSVDSSAVVDPNFVSTGDIDFVNTSNTITANINTGSIVNADINASAAIDISKTALVAGTNITLSTNTLNVDDAFLLNNGDTATGTYDFGGATFEIPNSTSLPGTCTVGQIYMDTDASTGQRIYACESTNTWALQGGSGAGSAAGSTTQVQFNSSGSFAGDAGLTYDSTNDMLAVSGGLTVGDGTNTSITFLRVDRADANATIAWDDTNDEFDFSHPINIMGGSDNYLIFGEATTAPNTSTSEGALYVKSDNELYYRNESNGFQVKLTSAGSVNAAAGSGDNVSVDSGAVTDPDFVSSGDIDFVNTTNTITANINAGVIVKADLAASTDFGDVSTDGSSNLLLDADVVGTAEMADADHGDVSWSGGVATVEDLQCTDCIGTTEISDVYLLNNGDAGTGVYDFSGATSLTLPYDAAPTVDASGEIALDTTITSYDGLLKYYDGTTEMTVVAMPTADLTTTDNHVVAYATGKSGFNMEAQTGGSAPTLFLGGTLLDPADADSILIHKAQIAMTITDIDCIVDPADSSESVVIDVQECTSTGDTCATVDATITCDNDGAADDGTLTNGSIDSGDWINLDIGTVTGTVTALTFTIKYTE